MGDRGNIFVINSIKDDAAHGVYLYTHWSGSEIAATAAKALASDAGQARATDTPYLTRILFDHLAGYYDGEKPGETGYGISTEMSDNEHDIVVIDPANQRVRMAQPGTERAVSLKLKWLSIDTFIRKAAQSGV